MSREVEDQNEHYPSPALPKYEYRERWIRRDVATRPSIEVYERFEQISVETLRTKFLQAVNELEPRVIRQLFNLSDKWGSGSGDYGALSGWARTWRLYDSWCMERAIRTVQHWQDHPPPRLNWYFPKITVPFVIKPFRAKLGVLNYDPTVDDPAELMRKFDSQIKAARKRLRAYINDSESKAKHAGLIKVSEKRRAIHFKWLAGFQVLRWSGRRIAEASDMLSERTALHAIKTLAREIGLTVRDDTDYDPAQDVGTIRRALGIPPANTQLTP